MDQPLTIIILYGSYRRERLGIRLVDYAAARFRDRGHSVELLDAQAIGLPMLDRMYKEYDAGDAPEAMERMAALLRRADAFVLVAGEYNWGVQPGLKNLVDHFLEEWFWRPAAVLTYSTTRTGGARAGTAWLPIVSELGMVPIPSTVCASDIAHSLDEEGQPQGEGGAGLDKGFAKTADALEWWANAARTQRLGTQPPY